jgi:mRNA interferase ChpB
MGCGTETQGVVLLNAIRMLDLESRAAQKVESAPDSIVQEALSILAAMLED